MSVLIKGMDMPQRCKSCRFCGFGGRMAELNVCMFTGESQSILSQERMSKCPLVPVPPHGRLIDADALLRYKGDCYDADGRLLYAVGTGSIMCASTIIEAEGKDDG